MATGKNFSCNDLGQRKASDLYETPYTITERLLREGVFAPELPILEPAAGHGAIVRVLKKYKFKKIVHYDLLEGKDFLQERRSFPQLITNPPYRLAYQFIQKAKEVVTQRFALLLPLAYLHGKQRYDHIYTDDLFKLKEIFVFTRYPMLGDPLREDGLYRTGMMVYAWYVWDKGYGGDPVIKWLDNNSDVISAKRV